ncbi:MAG TPA: RidA family protein [Kofleriaceae bacterium]|nr:RidA family protein [Kofleriaceae bacterium]
MSADDVVVPGPPPKGYSNGRIGRGAVLHVAGQVGWNEQLKFEHKDLVPQFAKALDNVLAVVAAAQGKPTDIAEMTVYVTDLDAYRRGRQELGAIWKQRLGRHYPAMALVEVKGLLEPDALVEIQAVAYVESAP